MSRTPIYDKFGLPEGHPMFIKMTPEDEERVISTFIDRFNELNPNPIFWGDALRNARGEGFPIRMRVRHYLNAFKTVEEAGDSYKPAMVMIHRGTEGSPGDRWIPAVTKYKRDPSRSMGGRKNRKTRKPRKSRKVTRRRR